MFNRWQSKRWRMSPCPKRKHNSYLQSISLHDEPPERKG
jgi:hypothetical protein